MTFLGGFELLPGWYRSPRFVLNLDDLNRPFGTWQREFLTRSPLLPTFWPPQKPPQQVIAHECRHFLWSIPVQPYPSGFLGAVKSFELSDLRNYSRR